MAEYCEGCKKRQDRIDELEGRFSDSLDELVVPTIVVRHDRSTSNVHALEIVQKMMLTNYHKRDYKECRDIESDSGKLFKVTELEKPEGGALSDCVFMVEHFRHNTPAQPPGG